MTDAYVAGYRAAIAALRAMADKRRAESRTELGPFLALTDAAEQLERKTPRRAPQFDLFR